MIGQLIFSLFFIGHRTGSKFTGADRKGCTQQTRNVIVTFSIGFKLVTLNLTFGKRLANVYVLCRHIFDV